MTSNIEKSFQLQRNLVIRELLLHNLIALILYYLVALVLGEKSLGFALALLALTLLQAAWQWNKLWAWTFNAEQFRISRYAQCGIEAKNLRLAWQDVKKVEYKRTPLLQRDYLLVLPTEASQKRPLRVALYLQNTEDRQETIALFKQYFPDFVQEG